MTEAKRPQITMQFEEVTPSVARQWLDRLADNQRKQKPSVIERYARDMRNGTFLTTGDPIRFDWNGRLIDGQQRLNAIIISGVPVMLLVVRGVDPEAMVVIDIGAQRTFADSLKITGTLRTSHVGAIVRRVIGWERGNYTGNTSSAELTPTRPELMAFYRDHMAAFDAAAHRGKDVANQKLGNATASGTAFYLFARLDVDAAHTFVERVIQGTNLHYGDPALTLSRKLARREWNTPEQLAGWIRAWNAFRIDATLTKIPLTARGELTNQNFPQPK